MKKILFIILIISIGLSERNLRDLKTMSYQRDDECSCEVGYVPDCSSNGDCCPESWI